MTLAQQVIALARRNGTLTQAERGHLDALLDRHVNVDSPDQLNWFLYGRAKRGDLSTRIPAHCGFKEQYRREKGRRTDKTTTNAEALLTLYRQYQEWECAGCGRRTTPERVTCSGCGKRREAEPVGPDKRIDLCLRLSALLTERGTLSAPIDADNHIRSSINLAATETQRHGSYKSNLDTGYALHTTTADHKHLFLAGDGYVMGSIDLAGADGWTIAAECKLCGDDVMLEDLRAGLKPAQAVALLYLHGQQVNSWPRKRVLASIPEVKAVGWLYPASKKVIWSTCYGSGPLSISAQILKESYGDTGVPLYVEPRLCGALQDLVHARYRGVKWRQNWLRATLQRDGIIEAPNGSRREFFGDRKDHATEREAFAFSPQVMTTWCTELAWSRLWYDPDNQCSAEPTVQPLLLVHDSLLCRWRRDCTSWVLPRLREWFNNPVTIAGTQVSVAFSGHYGKNWASASNLPGHPPLGKI